MDPATLALVAKGASATMAVASGISGFQQAKGEAERAKINSYIGRTRAIQTDTAARKGLTGELADVRGALAANGQGQNVGVFQLLDQIRTERARDQRIEVGNRNSEAADWRMAGKNAMSAGRGALIGGFGKALPSIFDMYEIYRNR